MIFSVPDMSCGHCRAAIEQAVTAAGGRATVDLPQKRVTVEGLDPDRAASVLQAAGFPAARLPAT
ncbi:heavy-metal-associated domain-containing protein [Paracoccus hibiscisoli]|uniref:Heavy-metal-associated domain-containing protein n=1 Tax=Paracoccus hibiscisoli TaxID=2023261 RepID=A0A4U0QZI8_9RHOB|nr:heavy-metal-associated domain-containing protein [Paracoccus hibiscisoli]TJZ87042.1 heavy-metal-associated domain-containing protein [Paracoccus hibiscisoli]